MDQLPLRIRSSIQPNRALHVEDAPIPVKTRARALEHEVTHIADIRFLAEEPPGNLSILPLVCSATVGVRGKVKRAGQLSDGSSRWQRGFLGPRVSPCAVEPFGRFRVLEPYEWDDMVPAYISFGRFRQGWIDAQGRREGR